MSKRTKLTKQKMPRWIWQLRLPGFHVQLKKYLKFIWRQRPDGCNWSRAGRAKFFNRTYHTIAKWDAFLLKYHLVWVSGKGTLEHRIGARPYYNRETWLIKAFGKPAPKARVMNYTPYTAQQKKSTRQTSSSAAGQQPLASAGQPSAESPGAGEVVLPGGCRPQPPARCSAGSGSSETSAPKAQPPPPTIRERCQQSPAFARHFDWHHPRMLKLLKKYVYREPAVRIFYAEAEIGLFDFDDCKQAPECFAFEDSGPIFLDLPIPPILEYCHHAGDCDSWPGLP